MRMHLLTATILTAAAALSTSADAQERRRGGQGQGAQRAQQLDEKTLTAAWTAQATTVGLDLGIDGETSKKLVEAYAAARTKHSGDLAKARQKVTESFELEGELGGEQVDRRQMRNLLVAAEADTLEASRAELAVQLLGFLDEKQTEEAIDRLGTFDNQWDRLAGTLAGYELDPAALSKAVAASEFYARTIAAARAEDPRSVREVMGAAREKLVGSLEGVLSAEQIESFNDDALTNRGALAGGRDGGNRASGLAARMAEMDTNGDGVLQKDELPERMQRMVERLDTNGDGELDMKEIEAAAGLGRGERGQRGQRGNRGGDRGDRGNRGGRRGGDGGGGDDNDNV